MGTNRARPFAEHFLNYSRCELVPFSVRTRADAGIFPSRSGAVQESFMARPQLSDALHALKGTKPKPNQRGERDRESVVTSGRPRCPAHVKSDPVAFAAFKDAVRILKKRRTVSAGDAPTLAVYAVVYSKWVKATADVNERGFEVEVERTNKAGEIYTATVPNVAVRVATDCERQLLQLAKSLGLTPDSREKIKPTKASEKDSSYQPEPGTVGAELAHLFDKNGRLKPNGKTN
jgi:P27 family predicted phage terminase small subunit